MRNRAKCKLCNSVIESKFKGDFVHCYCGEIAVDGGPDSYYVQARDYRNFLRIDDEDKEVEVKVVDKGEEELRRVNRAELIDNLRIMIERIEELPPQAMLTNINHYDYCGLLILLHSIFVSADSDQSQKEAD